LAEQGVDHLGALTGNYYLVVDFALVEGTKGERLVLGNILDEQDDLVFHF